MTKSQMIEYAKNTVKKYVEQDNLLVVKCGYDWQGIWASDGGIPAMFINTNSLIRSFSFVLNFNGREKQNEVCGGKNLYTPEEIKIDVERKGGEYLFDIYNTKGYFEELVVIENGEINKFDILLVVLISLANLCHSVWSVENQRKETVIRQSLFFGGH